MRKVCLFLLESALLVTLLATTAVAQDWSKAERRPFLKYITWDGTNWAAKLNGTAWVIARDGKWSRGEPPITSSILGGTRQDGGPNLMAAVLYLFPIVTGPSGRLRRTSITSPGAATNTQRPCSRMELFFC